MKIATYLTDEEILFLEEEADKLAAETSSAINKSILIRKYINETDLNKIDIVKTNTKDSKVCVFHIQADQFDLVENIADLRSTTKSKLLKSLIIHYIEE